VRQGQPRPEVGVEVDQVPGLVAQSRPGLLHRRDHDHDERERPGDRQQHPRIGDDEVDEGAPHASVGRGGVPEGDERDVGEHEGERGEPDEAVDTGQLVLAPGLLDPRDAGHQPHLEQQERRGDETGEPTRRGEEPCGGAEFLDAAAAHPQGDGEEHHAPAERGAEVAPPARHRPEAAAPRRSRGTREV
jgi:hypothetical protein